MVFGVMIPFSRILCCLLLLFFCIVFVYINCYRSQTILDYCLLVVCCKTTIIGKGHKTEHVQGGDEKVSFQEKKCSWAGNWGYTKVDRKAYVTVKIKHPKRTGEE